MRAKEHGRFLVAVLCALAFQPAASGALVPRDNELYISQRWQPEDGLPHHAVRGVAQAPDNYLWIITEGGLGRFDGVRVVPVFTAGLSNQPLNTIYKTRAGTILIGGDNGRLWQIVRGAVTPFPMPAGVGADAITTLFESNDGALWIGTIGKGVFKFGHGATTNLTMAEGLPHNSIRAICQDHDGNIWISTASGLSRYAKNKLKTYTSRNGLLHNSTRSLCVDRAGDVWIGSHFGLSRYSKGEFQNFTKNEGLSDNIVSSVFEDHEGQLWIGTLNGLTRRSGEKFVIETATDGGSFDRVYGISEDREQNIWVSTRDGLIRMKPRVLTTLTMQNGLSHNSASSILQDRAGAVWVGLWGGGVNRIAGDELAFFSRNEGLSSDLVLTLLQTRKGVMWFGTDYDGGLNVLSDRHITRYREKEDFIDHTVRALLEDREDRLWVGTRTALVSFENGTFRRYTMADGLPSNSIECLREDSNGRLWCGTDAGLAVRENGHFKTYSTAQGLSHPFVSNIFEDTEHDVWIATLGGLNHWRDGHFTEFTTRAGLFHDEIHGIQEDESGRLWLTSARGVFCVQKKNLKEFEAGVEKQISCTVFGKADGMLSVECKGTGSTALCKTRDGKLWVPTSKGVVVLDPKREIFNTEPSPLYIEEVLVDGHEVPTAEGLQLTADKREIVVRFTSPSFEAPEKMRFKYKLEGWDSAWIDAARREARYGRLPAGDYHFRVIGCNSDGLWNDWGAGLKISLHPPFHRTWWFLTAIGLSVSGLALGTVRYVSVKKIQSQLRRTEQEHAIERERTRIAQDMHDELGARLTEVLILSELAAKKNSSESTGHLTKMNSAVRDVIRNLDTIVWAVNPENDCLEKLIGYIHEYAQAYLETASIRCRFELPDKVVASVLPSDLRHSFFSVVKESLNNIVKHSRATEVKLQLRCDGEQLFFNVEDNGKGFSPPDAAHSGNGLKNMQKRMEAAGGHFELHSAPGSGTKICVRFPMKLIS